MRACVRVCVCALCMCICMWVYVRLYIQVYPPATRWEVREENRIGAPRRRKLFTSDSDNRKPKRERISGSIFGCFGKLGRNKEIGVPYNSLWFFFFVVFIYIYIYAHEFIVIDCLDFLMCVYARASRYLQIGKGN